VACKTVQHSQLKGKLKTNLRSEIEILKHIHHPHIVALIDIVETGNHIHLIMEFCAFGDLATFVKKRDKLAAHPITAEMVRHYPNPFNAGFHEVVVRHFAKQLGAALQFLRSKNLVHRDLKPQNLLLNPPPLWLAKERPEDRPFEPAKNSLIPEAGLMSLPTLKIADFGFARYLPTTTMAETLCGSPLYMAPEILRYEKYDAKADLWSVGTVLYELMVGKPPFRAANHVDLLRRIEKAMDKIKFPDDLVISEEMQKVIRALLKKMPTERMSWESFFESAVIIDEIPGLIAADREKILSQDLADTRPQTRRHHSERNLGGMISKPDEVQHAPPRPDPRQISGPLTTNSLVEPPTARHPPIPPAPGPRPPLISHATAPAAPAAQIIRQERVPAVNAAERRRTQNIPSPGTSAPKDNSERERHAQRLHERAAREARERTAQDVAFERDYVMVEKRAVEVNAFADELAASPHIHGGHREVISLPYGTMIRRATTQGATTSNTSAQLSPTRHMQIAVRPEGPHQRKLSYDRRYGPNKSSATSALAAALNMVNLRFYGAPYSSSIGKGSSPPQGYGPFPTFPATHTPPLLLGDSSKPSSMDEDQKVLASIEDCATRSDVVYGFAEVKYKQLIPLAPSNENALGIRRPGPSDSVGDDSSTADDDHDGLTLDAIIEIAEEALVLYVKALFIINKTTDLAGNWWSNRNRGDLTSETSSLPRSPFDSGRHNFPAVSLRVNHVVQWARNRYNECCEKTEYARRRLVEAQNKLPRQHAGHPKNRPSGDKESDSSELFMPTGVTAEKLMYDRALEMSKSAAVNELVNEDLPGCDVSYQTAIRLLEAVLDIDEEQSSRKRSSSTGEKEEKERKKEEEEEGSIDGIEEGDRKTVMTCGLFLRSQSDKTC